jgi:type I restriction-modification system DNA methylase subunit
MRLAGQEKMGYYPTPASLLDAIASYLSADSAGPCRVLDPCCGEGEALAHIAAELPRWTRECEFIDVEPALR